MPGFRTTGSLVSGRTVRRSMFWASIFRSGPNWPVGRIPTRWLVGFWRTRARGRVRITPWLVVGCSNCPLVRRHFGERLTGRIWLRKLSRSTSVFRGSFPVLPVLFPRGGRLRCILRLWLLGHSHGLLGRSPRARSSSLLAHSISARLPPIVSSPIDSERPDRTRPQLANSAAWLKTAMRAA